MLLILLNNFALFLLFSIIALFQSHFQTFLRVFDLFHFAISSHLRPPAVSLLYEDQLSLAHENKKVKRYFSAKMCRVGGHVAPRQPFGNTEGSMSYSTQEFLLT